MAEPPKGTCSCCEREFDEAELGSFGKDMVLCEDCFTNAIPKLREQLSSKDKRIKELEKFAYHPDRKREDWDCRGDCPECKAIAMPFQDRASEYEQRIEELVAELETQVGDKVDAQIRGNRLEGLRQANWERADDLEKENAALRKELEIRESPNEFCDSPDCEWCKLRRENADLKAKEEEVRKWAIFWSGKQFSPKALYELRDILDKKALRGSDLKAKGGDKK